MYEVPVRIYQYVSIVSILDAEEVVVQTVACQALREVLLSEVYIISEIPFVKGLERPPAIAWEFLL